MNDENIPESGKIVSKLLQSFCDLEKAIEGARSNLSANENIPTSVMKRLDSYSDILSRQRELAAILEGHVASGNIPEVARHISLINALSGMIIEDARGLLSGLSGQPQASDDDEVPFC